MLEALFEETERAFDKNERQMSELLKQTKQANGPAVSGFVITGYTKQGRFSLVTGVWEGTTG